MNPSSNTVVYISPAFHCILKNWIVFCFCARFFSTYIFLLTSPFFKRSSITFKLIVKPLHLYKTYSTHPWNWRIHPSCEVLISFCTVVKLCLKSLTLGFISIPRYKNPKSDQEKGEMDGYDVLLSKPTGIALALWKLIL